MKGIYNTCRGRYASEDEDEDEDEDEEDDDDLEVEDLIEEEEA